MGHARINNESKVKPLGRNVLLRVHARPDKTASGIILAERRGRAEMGEVLAVGAEVQSVTPGELANFDPYTLKLVITPAGPDTTNSVSASAGDLAIVHEDSLRYVMTTSVDRGSR